MLPDEEGIIMEITSFNPLIVTKDADSAVALFEALGFEKRHIKEGISENNATDIRMKNADGFHVDVTTEQAYERDMMGIRMNVDDFDAAYELLVSRGFKNAFGDETVNTKSSKSAMMVAPSGFMICIVHHIKEHD